MDNTQVHHTPDPWKAQHEFDDEPTYIIGPENSDICTFEPPYLDRVADINLVLAAPEMLLVLKQLQIFIASIPEEVLSMLEEPCPHIALANAITKAERGQHEKHDGQNSPTIQPL